MKKIKFVADQNNINEMNRFPEMVVEGFTLFKSLTDKYKITVDQKKQNRERIKRKLIEKSSQLQATARFETEHQESKTDLRNDGSPDMKSLSGIHDMSINKSLKGSSHQYAVIKSNTTAPNSSLVNTSIPSRLSLQK